MKVSNVEIMGLDSSIKASKYPMAIDTDVCTNEVTKTTIKLAQSGMGEGHDQFLTGIVVNFDLRCTNKMWVELERYRFINFVSSQSTMHRITKLDIRQQCNDYVWDSTIDKLEGAVRVYNQMVEMKLEPELIKDKYLEILYNVPSGFELTARLTTNYRALKTVYSQRHQHKLPEWREFCEWIKTLPMAEDLIVR